MYETVNPYLILLQLIVRLDFTNTNPDPALRLFKNHLGLKQIPKTFVVILAVKQFISINEQILLSHFCFVGHALLGSRHVVIG